MSDASLSLFDIFNVSTFSTCLNFFSVKSLFFRTINKLSNTNYLQHVFFWLENTTNKRTLTLKQDAADRISGLVEIYGGTVQAFAGSLASDISRLPPEEIHRIRQEIMQRVNAYELAKSMAETRNKIVNTV